MAKPIFSQEDLDAWFMRLNDDTFPLSSKKGIMPLLAPKYVAGNAEERTTVFSFQVQDWQLNPEKSLHGGMITTFMDMAFGITCHYFSQKEMVTTVSQMTTYLKPILPNDTVYCHTRITSLGRTIVNMVGEIRTERDDILAATATTSFMVLRPRD